MSTPTPTAQPSASSHPHAPASTPNPAQSPELKRRRLYMHLQVVTGVASVEDAVRGVQRAGIEGVLYLDVHNPRGVGLLSMAEDPDQLIRATRNLNASSPWSAYQPVPELTMFGCTYTTGREQDPNDWLLGKPRRAALRADWPWAVWYPLRRKPEFALLSREEQGRIMAEHGMVGSGYIEAGVAADIRLSCYGLDKNDNEFIIGLTGPELFPLSSLVQEMRRTQHTAKYIQTLGPFFIGRAHWQSAAPKSEVIA